MTIHSEQLLKSLTVLLFVLLYKVKVKNSMTFQMKAIKQYLSVVLSKL